MGKMSLVLSVALIYMGLVFSIAGCAGRTTIEQPGGAKAPTDQEMVPGQSSVSPGEESWQANEIPPKISDSILLEKISSFENAHIYFDFDQFSLTSESRDILAGKAAFLRDNPSLKIRIEGHCDERGTIAYNVALGERRAKAVQDHMISVGVDKNRLSTISFGEEKPFDPGHTEDAWTKNRRAQFVVVNK